MRDAEEIRNEDLKNEKFFRVEDIEEKERDLPNVKLPKRSPSNNLESVMHDRIK